MWADYVLIPSRIESIPVVFSDAMQCDTPVIATPVGDLPALLSKNRAGILATEVSSVAYYKAICRSLEMSPGDFSTDIMQVKRQFNIKSVVDCFYKCVESRNTISVENDIHEIN
jgi:Glycosyltransferase